LSGVSDGATTRKERIFDLLRYVRGFMPKGIPMNQIQMYMSLSHGLTYKKSQEYVIEMQTSGVLMFQAGYVQINQSQFRRLMEVMAPERDPETGLRLQAESFDLDMIGLGNKADIADIAQRSPEEIAEAIKLLRGVQKVQKINAELEKKKKKKTKKK